MDIFLDKEEKEALHSLFSHDSSPLNKNQRSSDRSGDDDEDEANIKEAAPTAPGFTDHLSELNEHFQNLWKPPTRGVGMLIAGRFLITFDSAVIELTPSRCSSLLVGPIMESQVSVKLTYNSDLSPVLLVSAQKHEIQVYPKLNQVRLNGKLVDLPIFLKSGSVLRKTNSVELNFGQTESKDLTIECFLKRDFCTFSLSERYRNKTSGLFGNFDGSLDNDNIVMEVPKIFNSPEMLVSLLPSKSCRVNFHPFANLTDLTKESSKGFRSCDKLHAYLALQVAKDSGPVVDPEIYQKICLKLTSSSGQDDTKLMKSFCDVAAAYVQTAKQYSIELVAPFQCLFCENHVRFGSRHMIEPFGESRLADIIYVVQESPCLTHLIDNLVGMSKLLENILGKSDMLGTRFGLISFGHHDGLWSVNSHSVDGDLLFPAEKAGRAADGLSLRHLKSPQKVDIYEALARAFQYPFRKGSSKNVVLMTCQSCSLISQSRFDYNDLRAILLSQGITLHLFSNQPLTMVKPSRKTSASIVGIDADLIVTSSQADGSFNDLEESLELKRRVSLPNDVCLVLAHISGGSYFPIPKKSFGRKWQIPVANWIASGAEPKFCQICDCILDENMIDSRTVCKPCKPLEEKSE